MFRVLDLDVQGLVLRMFRLIPLLWLRRVLGVEG